MPQLLPIFLNVLGPVFALVAVGYLFGPRLALDARTLARVCFFIVAPAFIFKVVSTAKIEVGLALRMTFYIASVHILSALIAYRFARWLNRSPKMTVIYVLAAVFGNIGNFGLPIIQFALGESALTIGTFYFLILTVLSFAIGMTVIHWGKGSHFETAWEVLKTPSIFVVFPALLCNWSHIDLPPFLFRSLDLLASMMIPLMLLALGVQLASVGFPHLSLDIVLASGLRLLLAPLLAFLLAIPFGLAGQERGAGLLQASMPVAVVTSVIALEYDLLPNFVMALILFSTLASIVTLTFILAFLL